MQSFYNLSFRWKLTLPLLFLALLFLVEGALAYRTVADLQQRLRHVAEELLPQSTTLLEADRDLYQAQAAERAIVAGVLEPGLLDEHRANSQQAHERIQAYARSTDSERGRALAAEFERAFATWQQASLRAISLAQRGSSDDMDQAGDLSFGDGLQQFSAARNLIDRLTDLTNEEVGIERTLAAEAAEAGQMLVLGTLLAGLCLFALLIVLFPGVVTKPLRSMLARIEDIADGEGDLTRRVDIASRDELGQLGGALNRFLGQLQGLVRQVAESTHQVTDASLEMDRIASRQQSLVNDQYQAIDQVSTAATEMSAAIHEVASNAHNAAQSAEDADRQGRVSSQVVAATMDALRRLAADVGEAAHVIDRLEQDTGRIDGVLSVIEGIAEQTNLLALNAAIEAARAGEQGRGFAVVADEVRALAARTQASTRDIQQMMQSLQAATAQAVGVMQRGVAIAEQGVSQAPDVERSLTEAAHSVVRINDMAAQIATACEEQSQTTEDIARNISDIQALSNQSAEASEHSRTTSERMVRLAETLSQQVGRFKT
ncbi:methyl-accepting chemotaxis protein [Stutzerimonas urumqiensis]|uniref:methyl-accepting chemotaxis protein n=1 Tax=Stutzerimonas urumqiensis TaxID=638269 RepID=UPI000EABCCF3|nr:methyl-accepting chemotaxis protein [Stutzerimonas urumqiensis]